MLKIFSKTLFIVFLIFLNNFFLYSGCKKDNTEKNLIKLPVYINSFNLKTGLDPSSHCNYVHYNVKIDFPALDVIGFYNKEFEKKSFKNYFEDGFVSFNRWENFNNSSGVFEPTDKPPGRYQKLFVDEKKEKIIILVLFYRYKYEQDWEHNLLVDCRICSFSNWKEDTEFIDKHLSKHGEK